MRKSGYVLLFVVVVATIGVVMLNKQLPMGPTVIGISIIPFLGLIFAHRPLTRAVPDIVFGTIDTGLLTIPALWGGIRFGVAGAIVYCSPLTESRF